MKEQLLQSSEHNNLSYDKRTIRHFFSQRSNQWGDTLHLCSADGTSLLLIQPLQDADLTEDVVTVQRDRTSDGCIKAHRALLQMLQAASTQGGGSGILFNGGIMSILLPTSTDKQKQLHQKQLTRVCVK